MPQDLLTKAIPPIPITSVQVRLGGSVLLLHQLCQHEVQRRHQANHEQLHALHLCCRHVIPAEPHAHDPTLLWLNLIFRQFEISGKS